MKEKKRSENDKKKKTIIQMLGVIMKRMSVTLDDVNKRIKKKVPNFNGEKEKRGSYIRGTCTVAHVLGGSRRRH